MKHIPTLILNSLNFHYASLILKTMEMFPDKMKISIAYESLIIFSFENNKLKILREFYEE